ncbi:hypothetical protein TNCV_5115771, partial [Trichonephila clavipes]
SLEAQEPISSKRLQSVGEQQLLKQQRVNYEAENCVSMSGLRS